MSEMSASFRELVQSYLKTCYGMVCIYISFPSIGYGSRLTLGLELPGSGGVFIWHKTFGVSLTVNRGDYHFQDLLLEHCLV